MPARGPNCPKVRFGRGDCPGSRQACDWCYGPSGVFAYSPRGSVYTLSSGCDKLGPKHHLGDQESVYRYVDDRCRRQLLLLTGRAAIISAPNVDANRFKQAGNCGPGISHGQVAPKLRPAMRMRHSRPRTQLPESPVRLGQLPGKPSGLQLVLRTVRRLRLFAAWERLHAIIRLRQARLQHHVGDQEHANLDVDGRGRRQLLLRRTRRLHLHECGSLPVQAGGQLRSVTEPPPAPDDVYYTS